MTGRLFKIPFATSGDRTSIPDAVQPSGAVSFTEGFGFDYERENTDPDYKPVPREETNALNHDITEAIGIMQLQGVADWFDPATSGINYAINALVRHTDVVWRSLVANNSATPVEGANWTNLSVTVAAASTTVAGIVELATGAEVITGSDNTRAVTPLALQSLTATTTRAGIVELATSAETQAQASSTLAIPPSGLLNFKLPTDAQYIVTADSSSTDGSTDFNTIQTSGWYYRILGAAAGSRQANHPDGQTAAATGNGVADFYWLLVLKHSTNVFQCAFPYATNDASKSTPKIRSLTSGVWTAWTTLIDSRFTATDTAAGLVELATSAETVAGTDTTRAVTPDGLAAVVATTSVRGLVELATNTETVTGTDTTRAVTPDGLEAWHAARRFISADIPFVAGGAFTVTHSLGFTPRQVRMHYKCLIAQHGYGAGELLDVGTWISSDNSVGSYGVSVFDISTSILNGRFGNTRTPRVPVKSTGAVADTTAANWALVLEITG